MLALIPPGSLWLVVLLIAVATVLACLRAIATVIGRETLIHDLRVEARQKQLSEPCVSEPPRQRGG